MDSENVLPELKKGDVLVRKTGGNEIESFTVRSIGQGQEFEEPVYFLAGKYGVKLKKPYTVEELANAGFTLKGEVR